jgi:hypothetical protein
VNLALLSILLPVLCQPVTGSLLRFPNLPIFSFSPEQQTDWRLLLAGDWDGPPDVFDVLPEISDEDIVVTSEIDIRTSFGPNREIRLIQAAYFPEGAHRAFSKPGTPASDDESSPVWSLVAGFACFGMTLFIQLPRLILRRTTNRPMRGHSRTKPLLSRAACISR